MIPSAAAWPLALRVDGDVPYGSSCCSLVVGHGQDGREDLREALHVCEDVSDCWDDGRSCLPVSEVPEILIDCSIGIRRFRSVEVHGQRACPVAWRDGEACDGVQVSKEHATGDKKGQPKACAQAPHDPFLHASPLWAVVHVSCVVRTPPSSAGRGDNQGQMPVAAGTSESV